MIHVFLEGAIFEQDGDSIYDGKAPAALKTADGGCFELQRVAAHGADEPAEVIGFECGGAHIAILTGERGGAIPWKR